MVTIYSEYNKLRENLIFDIIAPSSKGDLSVFERLFIVQHFKKNNQVNQRWLADLYIRCGCFTEAKQIFSVLGHWRKLGDLSWAYGYEGDAEFYYSKSEDKNGPVFRGGKDWDRLIKLFFSQSRWDDVLELFSQAKMNALSPKSIILGNSAVTSLPFQRIFSIAVNESGRSFSSGFLKKYAELFSIERKEFELFITATSDLTPKDLAKIQKKCTPRIRKISKQRLEDALKKGETFKASKIIFSLGNIAELVQKSYAAIDDLIDNNPNQNINFSDIINGFFEESLAKTFINFVIPRANHFLYKDLEFKSRMRVFESHPLVKRLYFSEYLKLKFDNNASIKSEDIFTSLLQTLYVSESDKLLSSTTENKNEQLINFDKLICYSEWAMLKTSEWLERNGIEQIEKAVSMWHLINSEVSVNNMRNHREKNIYSPCEMVEWKESVRSCHEYLSHFWYLEIGKEKWKSEKALYEIVKRIFKNYKVSRHAQPIWLQPQHFDIYIPELSLAIEYMGEQHFRPIDYFGGEQAYEVNIERDRRKAQLCAKTETKLFYVRYDDDIKMKMKELVHITKDLTTG